jgi:hypothetical protein
MDKFLCLQQKIFIWLPNSLKTSKVGLDHSYTNSTCHCYLDSIRVYASWQSSFLSNCHWIFYIVQCSGSTGSTCFGLPVSGSTRKRYGSGSGSFCHQEKIVRKTLIPTGSWLLFDFLSLTNDVNVPSKSNKQKNLFKKLVFCWRLESQWRK